MKQVQSNQTRGYRLVASLPVVADNAQFNIDIPRGPHIESCFVRISGTINNTVAFTTARAGAPLYMLRRADWVLNSNVTLDSVSGQQAHQLATLTRRNLPPLVSPAVGIGATSFEAYFYLDRAMMDGVRPKDSLLKTDVGVSNNQLRLQLGALANMFTGAGTSTYTSVTLEVSITDYQESRDDAGNTPSPLFYLKRNGVFSPTLAAGNGQQIKINTGNRLRIISFRALDGTTLEPNATGGPGAVGPAAFVSRIRLQRAGDTRVDMPLNLLTRQLQGAVGATGLTTGQVAIDFANNGQLGMKYSEFWPIPSSADTYLLVDVVASTVLEIATLEGVDLPQG
jgi:hypothetical protein